MTISPKTALDGCIGSLFGHRGYIMSSRTVSPEANQSELIMKQLFACPFVAIMEGSHPLAQKPLLTIADLMNVNLAQLLWEQARSGWDIIEALCLKNGFEPKRKPFPVRSSAESIATLPEGCVLIYPGGATKELKYLTESSGKVCLGFSDEDAVFSICTIYRKDNEAKLRPFIEALEAATANILRKS
jgi:DNA-binding transcriptional LysR family regulator